MKIAYFCRWNVHNYRYDPETCGKVCIVSCFVLELYMSTLCML